MEKCAKPTAPTPKACIIQSIPLPKAEPFTRWLPQVDFGRVKEIESPELASARTRELYQAKGFQTLINAAVLAPIDPDPAPVTAKALRCA